MIHYLPTERSTSIAEQRGLESFRSALLGWSAACKVRSGYSATVEPEQQRDNDSYEGSNLVYSQYDLRGYSSTSSSTNPFGYQPRQEK
jgi:hypothetical protein